MSQLQLITIGLTALILLLMTLFACLGREGSRLRLRALRAILALAALAAGSAVAAGAPAVSGLNVMTVALLGAPGYALLWAIALL